MHRLKDEAVHEFSDMLEVYVIELNKPLSGTGRMNRLALCLIQAECQEDIKKPQWTKNTAVNCIDNLG